MIANCIIMSHFGNRDLVLPQNGFILDCIKRPGVTIPWSKVIDCDRFNNVIGPELGLTCKLIPSLPPTLGGRPTKVQRGCFPWSNPRYSMFMNKTIEEFGHVLKAWSMNPANPNCVEIYHAFDLGMFKNGFDILNCRCAWTRMLTAQIPYVQELYDIAEEVKKDLFERSKREMDSYSGTDFTSNINSDLARERFAYNVLHLRIEDDPLKCFLRRVTHENIVEIFSHAIDKYCLTSSLPLFIASDLNKHTHKYSWFLKTMKQKYKGKIMLSEWDTLMLPRLHSFVSKVKPDEWRNRGQYHYRELAGIIELIICLGGVHATGCEWSTFTEAIMAKLGSMSHHTVIRSDSAGRGRDVLTFRFGQPAVWKPLPQV